MCVGAYLGPQRYVMQYIILRLWSARTRTACGVSAASCELLAQQRGQQFALCLGAPAASRQQPAAGGTGPGGPRFGPWALWASEGE
jgi:hypothetical protein